MLSHPFLRRQRQWSSNLRFAEVALEALLLRCASTVYVEVVWNWMCTNRHRNTRCFTPHFQLTVGNRCRNEYGSERIEHSRTCRFNGGTEEDFVFKRQPTKKNLDANTEMGFRYQMQYEMLMIGDVVTEVKLPQGGHWSGFQRAEFLKVIYEAVSKNDKVRLHTNKRVIKVETASDREMKVTFEDGTEATANLVIGADGIHSVVRSKYLQDEAIFSGIVAYRSLIPTDKVREFWPIDDSDVAGFWSKQGKAFLTYTPF